MVFEYYTVDCLTTDAPSRSLRNFDNVIRSRRAVSEMPRFSQSMESLNHTIHRRAPSVFSSPVTRTYVEPIHVSRSFYSPRSYSVPSFYRSPYRPSMSTHVSVSKYPYWISPAATYSSPYRLSPLYDPVPYTSYNNSVNLLPLLSSTYSPSSYYAPSHFSPYSSYYPHSYYSNYPSFSSGYHSNYHYLPRYYNGLSTAYPSYSSASYPLPWISGINPLIPYVAPASHAAITVSTPSAERKRIEKSLDYNDLSSGFPTSDTYLSLHQSLRDLNGKVLTHKMLLDRYAGIDLSPSQSVAYNVDNKYRELVERMPELERFNENAGRLHSNKVEPHSPRSHYNQNFTLNDVDSKGTTDLRHRIRRLICRSRNNPHYY